MFPESAAAGGGQKGLRFGKNLFTITKHGILNFTANKSCWKKEN